MKLPKTIRLFALCALLTSPLFGDTDPLGNMNGIAAIADDKAITLEKLKKEMDPYIPNIQRVALSQDDLDKRVATLEKEILQSLVDRVLIVKEFKRQGGQIPKYYIDNELDDKINIHFGGDRTRFTKELAKDGRTLQDYRRELEEYIIVSVMTNKIKSSAAEISPKKIEAYYESNKSSFVDDEKIHLRQITLSADSKKQIASIQKDLNEGKAFAEVASKYGIDEMKGRGGDWGWVYREDLLPELSKTAFALEPGAYSDPVELNDHIFILYQESKQSKGIKSLSSVRTLIEERLEADASWQAQQQWLQELRDKTYVKYFLAG